MKLKHCNNFHDFRKLAKKNLPSPIFHYIDGAADAPGRPRERHRADGHHGGARAHPGL